MNPTRQTFVALAGVAVCAAVALGVIVSFTETFENISGGDPQRGWTFNAGVESIAVRNGNH